MHRDQPCLEARDLSHAYASQAADVGAGFRLTLDRLTLQWGRSLACIGPSGCGKTTLALILCGVLVPTTGEVCFKGRSLRSLDDAGRRDLRLRRFGLVFQELELIPWLDARDNILLPYRASVDLRLDARAHERADQLAERLEVGHTLRRKPARLSQGERQRIAICRALVTDPDVMFFDEPTGNLDAGRSEIVLDLLRDEVAARQAALFLITHEASLCHRFDEVLDLSTAVGRITVNTAAGTEASTS